MKKWKYFFAFIALAVIVLTTFFLWASSPQLAASDYEKLITYENQSSLEKDSTYSIVTYNIGYLSGMTNNKAVAKPKSLYDNNLLLVKDLLKRLQPDIIALQEIDFKSERSYFVNQQDELSSTGYQYAAQAVNWDENYVPFPYWPPSVHFGRMLSGQSILSKYPIGKHERIVLDRVADAPFYRDALYLERLAQIVQVELNSKKVILINVHLEAFDKSTRVQQFNAILELFDQYKEIHPTILLGDFNSPASDPNAVIHKLFEQKEVGNAAFDKQAISNTFSSEDPFKRIDYIFYTKNNIELIDARVLSEFGAASDHLPVYMQFKLK